MYTLRNSNFVKKIDILNLCTMWNFICLTEKRSQFIEKYMKEEMKQFSIVKLKSNIW